MPEARNSLQEDLFPSTLTLAEENEENEHFRRKLTFGLGIAEIFCGVMLGVFGLLSMNMEAAMSSLAGGVWAGGVAITTGLSAICLAKCSRKSNLCCTVSLFISGQCADRRFGYCVCSDRLGSRCSMASWLLSDCALAVACCGIVAAQEACQCYVCSDDDDPVDHDSKVRHDRLVTWLGQQALLDFVMASGKLPENFNPATVINNNQSLSTNVNNKGRQRVSQMIFM
ncbi:uncharacterized protein CEXT_702651 [Caerostris extrusa]|uniref:Uncharacterized protein n=1 Tax=Caerostris extrusa TaxID=172846 RepID=A0AAV4UL73_CAEEX|nr:uncharacterized protein CEXT_702651 [Caerostris extrusa]